MIYCREQLVDIILESKFISIEDRIDLELAVEKCLSIGHFSYSEWKQALEFLSGADRFTPAVDRIICVLADELGYTDERFLHDKGSVAKAIYKKLERGVRL
jgi:hypothetical protein